MSGGDSPFALASGSPFATAGGFAPQHVAAYEESPSRRRHKRKTSETDSINLRCEECGKECVGWGSWAHHLGDSQLCREVGAECEPYDPETEARERLQVDTGQAAYETDMRAHMCEQYSALVYDRLCDRQSVQSGVKESLVEPMVAKMKAEIYQRLARTPAELQTLDQQIGTVFEVHRGIETAIKEETAVRAMYNVVKPVKRDLIDAPDDDGKPTGPRRGDFVYDVPIKEELEAMVLAEEGLLDRLRAAADAWVCDRPAPGSAKKVYVDIADGAVLQNHPELGVDADRSDGSVRLAFILYYDDLEVVNALGAFHGTHKLGMFYWALVNERQEVRMAFHNLHLATVALVSDIDYYGISQVVSGLPGDSSFGSSMTALHDGITVDTPSGGALVRGWTMLVSADYPAAGLLAGFKKSVSARIFCRECDCDKTSDEYPAPNSFMEENAELDQHHLLREHEQWERDLKHFLTLRSSTERNSFLASIGVTTFHEHAFTRIPLFDLCTMIPYDFMHVELEGVHR